MSGGPTARSEPCKNRTFFGGEVEDNALKKQFLPPLIAYLRQVAAAELGAVGLLEFSSPSAKLHPFTIDGEVEDWLVSAQTESCRRSLRDCSRIFGFILKYLKSFFRKVEDDADTFPVNTSATLSEIFEQFSECAKHTQLAV